MAKNNDFETCSNVLRFLPTQESKCIFQSNSFAQQNRDEKNNTAEV